MDLSFDTRQREIKEPTRIRSFQTSIHPYIHPSDTFMSSNLLSHKTTKRNETKRQAAIRKNQYINFYCHSFTMTSEGANTALLEQNNQPPSRNISSSSWAILNGLAYIFNVAVTYGIGVGGFLDFLPTNAQISAKYPTLLTPSGWAFSIWGGIFLLQAIWVLYPWVAKVASSSSMHIVRYNYLWIVLLQAAWTWAFSHEWIIASAVIMTALAVVLWKTTVRLWNSSSNKNNATTEEQASSSSTSYYYYVLQVLPFTLHTGWITVATAVNLNVLWIALYIDREIQFVFALLCLAGLGYIAGIYALQRDVTIPLVAAWALLGITAHVTEARLHPPYDTPVDGNMPLADRFTPHQLDTVRYAAAALAALLVVAVVVVRTRRC